MDMPVNPMQQGIASVLAHLGDYATEVWFVLGSGGAAILTLLAIWPLLPQGSHERLNRSRLAWLPGSDRVFLLACVVFIVILRLPGLSQLELNPDESNLVLSARTLLQDLRFWISVEVQAIGPISTLAAMLPGVVGLPIDYTTIRGMAIATWCVVAIALFAGFRLLYPAALARVLVLPLVLTAATFRFFDYVAFNGEHMAAVLLALSFMLHAGLFRAGESAHPIRSFLLGATLALIPFTKIQAAPIAVAWGALACIFAFRLHPVRVLYHVGGAGLVGALALIGLVATGAWHDFWQSYILNNLIYAQVGWNATQQDVTLLANALYAPWYFLTPPDSRGLFLFALLALVVASIVALVRRPPISAIGGRDWKLAMVLVLVAGFCVILPKNNWTHYLLLLFVPVSMLTASLLAGVYRTLESPMRSGELPPGAMPVTRPTPHLLTLGVIAAVLGGYASAQYTLLQGNPATRMASENLQNGNTPNVVTAAILRHATPGEPVALWGMLYSDLASAGVSLGTREAHNERALFPSVQQQYYLDRWIGDLDKRRPRLMIDSGAGEKFAQFRLANYPREYAEVLSRYTLIDQVEDFHIYRLLEAP